MLRSGWRLANVVDNIALVSEDTLWNYKKKQQLFGGIKKQLFGGNSLGH